MLFKPRSTKYKDAQHWAYDLYQSQSLWLRRVLYAFVMLFVLLLLSISANLFLIPFKEKVPYLYAFDKATGEVTKIGTLEKSTLVDNWELTRYFLINYIINRESYHFDNIDLPYQQVWSQSADKVRVEYESQVKSSNSNSPYRIFGKDKFVTVHVTAINRLNDNTVDIKFVKKCHDSAANTDQVIPKEAIVKWDYSKAELSEKMLERDPLGFKVTYYQVSQVNLDTQSGV